MVYWQVVNVPTTGGNEHAEAMIKPPLSSSLDTGPSTNVWRCDGISEVSPMYFIMLKLSSSISQQLNCRTF